MQALFKPIGLLKTYTQGDVTLSFDAPITIRQGLQQIGIPADLVALVLANGKQANKDDLLHDKDEIQLITVLGGG
jgi:sulfur carrier protein ThiS